MERMTNAHFQPEILTTNSSIQDREPVNELHCTIDQIQNKKSSQTPVAEPEKFIICLNPLQEAKKSTLVPQALHYSSIWTSDKGRPHLPSHKLLVVLTHGFFYTIILVHD